MTEPALFPVADIVTSDPWTDLRAATPARLALGRAGAALPTGQVLELAMAHARARDAVHAEFRPQQIIEELRSLGCECIALESAAATRDIYLRRPDLGRRLSPHCRNLLEHRPAATADIAIIVGDGLSAKAVHENAAAVVAPLVDLFRSNRYSLFPIVVASQARVALADEIGELLGCRIAVMLIGERPGMSASDSLGAYLTSAPRVGRTDAERNCVSNIRLKGLPPARAAAKVAWLTERGLALSMTGVALKDDSDVAVASTRETARIEN